MGYVLYIALVNPRRTCARVNVVVLCDCLSFCVSVTMKSATHFVYTSKTRYHRVLYGVFEVFCRVALAENASFKSSFGDHHCFPCFLASSRWTEGTGNGLFSTKLVSRLSVISCNTTDLSLIMLK